MSALLALGLLHYGLVTFQPAHIDAQNGPPPAGFSLRLQVTQSHAHHSNGALHVHAGSPFVIASVSALNAAHEASSVAYQRLRAARIETRANAPPLRPPRLDL